MLIGYARVSTQDQNLELQREALTKAGCEKVFEDKVSGTWAERPGLAKAVEILRGDILVVWKLDRLGRSVKQLVDLVSELDCSPAASRPRTWPKTWACPFLRSTAGCRPPRTLSVQFFPCHEQRHWLPVTSERSGEIANFSAALSQAASSANVECSRRPSLA